MHRRDSGSSVISDATSMSDNSFPRFLAVGGGTALIYFGLLYVLLDYLGWGRFVGVSIAYSVAITFHFFSNRHFSFVATDSAVAPQATKYLAMAFINYLITLAVVEVIVSVMGLSAYFGVATSIVVTVFSGYLFSKYWVFRIGHEYK